MSFLKALRGRHLLVNLGVAGAYLLLAKIGLLFALESPTITIFWPAGGFALAIILLRGPSVIPGLFLGSMLAGLMVHQTISSSALLALANMLETVTAYLLLTRYCKIQPTLDDRRDLFWLLFSGGVVGSSLSALAGTGTLWITGQISTELFGVIMMRWWMADLLGITFMTPLILIWSKRPRYLIRPGMGWEISVLFALSMLTGQIVFMNWFNESLGFEVTPSWIWPFIIWAGVRAGRHKVMLLQLVLFAQALGGASHGLGFYAEDMARNGLFNFWIFGMVLSMGGLLLAILTSEQERGLQEQRMLHTAISASLNEIYLFSADTLKFIFANHGALNNLGYSMEEMKTLTPLDISPYFTQEAFEALIVPLRNHELRENTFETLHERKDGSLYPVEVHLQLLDDSDEHFFLAVIMDTTERLAAEQEMRLAAQVFESSSDGVMITDSENRIIRTNRAFTDITGYPEDEVLGQNPRMLGSGANDNALFSDMWSSLMSADRWQGEHWNRHKNGEIYLVWQRISVIRDACGNPVNYIGLFTDITARKASEESVKHQAQHDHLTGLPNRILFKDRFAQQLARARRNKESFALLYMDLDNFKPVNDQYGHYFGDLLLKEVANRLLGATREMDTVSRQGGDEFTILVPGIESIEHVRSFAEKLLVAVSAPYVIECVTLQVTLSIGIALYPEDGEDEDSLTRSADLAMYQAKRHGRNNYHFSNDDLTGA